MQVKQFWIKYKAHIIWGAAVLVAMILLVTVLAPKRRPSSEYKKEIQALDRVVKANERHVITLEEARRRNTMEIGMLRAEVSELKKKYQTNRPKESTLKTNYEKIPPAVDRLSNDSLRRAIAEY